MVTLGALWLPILVSAVLVFIVSSILHMVLKYHSRGYIKLANEDAVRAAIRSGNPEPRMYVIPYMADYSELKTPEMQQKFAEGPVGTLTIRKPGAYAMGPSLVQWFVFSLVIAYFAAYIASRTIQAGADYLHVFRVVGTVAFLGYAGGAIPPSIWMGKPWSITFTDIFDGLIYGLVTAGAFGWLWPR